jgi:hypothetical protein
MNWLNQLARKFAGGKKEFATTAAKVVSRVSENSVPTKGRRGVITATAGGPAKLFSFITVAPRLLGSGRIFSVCLVANWGKV